MSLFNFLTYSCRLIEYDCKVKALHLMLTGTVQEQPQNAGEVAAVNHMATSEPMSIDALPSLPAQFLLPYQVQHLSTPLHFLYQQLRHIHLF